MGAIIIASTGGFGGFVASWWGAAIVGAASGGVGAAVNGGNILEGIAFGALGAAAFFGVGEAFSVFNCADCYSLITGKLTAFAKVAKVAAHGITGGVMSALQGGKFGHGFAAAGFSSLAGGALKGTKIVATDYGRVLTRAAIGGTVSRISGGKFGNGAASAAFSALVDEALARQSEAIEKGGKDVQGQAGTGIGLSFTKTRLAGKIIQDENGNLTLNATVGYEDSEKIAAQDFVDSVSRDWTVSRGKKSITLTVNLELVEGIGDINIISSESMRSLSQDFSFQKSFERNNCEKTACSVGSVGAISFPNTPNNAGLHELFHSFGYSGHAAGGILKHGGGPSNLRYRDLKKLRTDLSDE